jgi:hypothetical protein
MRAYSTSGSRCPPVIASGVMARLVGTVSDAGGADAEEVEGDDEGGVEDAEDQADDHGTARCQRCTRPSHQS